MKLRLVIPSSLRGPEKLSLAFCVLVVLFMNLRDNFRNSFLRHAWAIYQEGIRQIICLDNPKMIISGPEAEDRENGS
jgi:hypothetical protein